ncbi:MAG: hypothetical protein C4527_29530 [Candidatus Omnitrophota bacterium]|nr:MAG: hypothetical protein C4527_29530 [Candidatus Omnitrophota bacterium]
MPGRFRRNLQLIFFIVSLVIECLRRFLLDELSKLLRIEDEIMERDRYPLFECLEETGNFFE